MTRRLGGIGSKSLAAFSSLSLATALACGYAMTGCGGDSTPTTQPDTGTDSALPDVVQDRGSDTTTPDANEGGMDVTVDRGPDVTPIPDAGPDAPVLPACGAPTFMPAAGTIQQGTTVTIVPPTGFPMTGEIFYTIDKTQPFHGATGSSPIYTGPIQVNGALTINAIAYAPGTCTDSALGTASYTTTLGDGGLAPPAFTPPGQTQNNDFTLALASTPGATICYTIDGVTTPTCNATTGMCTGASTYNPGSPISINGTITNATTGQVKVQAISCAPGATPTAVISQTYGLKVASPAFQAPAPTTVAYTTAGTTPTVSTTTISSTTSSATNAPFMRYTTDGSTPTCAVGTEVNGAAGGNSGTVTFTTSTSYMAIGCKNGYAPSDPTTAAYTVQLNPPGFQLGTGTYYDTVAPGLSSTTNGTATIQSPGGEWVCYSTTGAATCAAAAGTCGTGSTNQATTASSITKTGTVLNAVTCTPNAAQYISSMGMPAQTYTLQLRPIVFNPVTGNPIPMGGTLTVHMTEANTSAPNAAWNLFCYTTDGTTMPDCTCTGTNQHLGVAPGSFAGDWAAPAIGPTTTSVTVYAEGCDTTGNFLATGVQTASYPNAGTMAPPTLVPANTTPLNNNTALTFTNADTTESATICWTTDGSTPTCGQSTTGVRGCTGTVATGATSTMGPTLTATATTVKAIACDAGGAGKTTSSASSSVYTLQVALPTIAPNGGSNVIGSAVTLSTTTSGASFIYTTDGSTPTCAGGGTTHTLASTGTGPYTAAFALAGTETKVNVIACRGSYTDSTVAPGNAITAWTVPQPTFRYGTGTYDDLLTGGSTERIIVNPANPAAGVTWLCVGTDASCGATMGNCGGTVATPVTGLACAVNPDGVTQSCTANQSITVSGSTLRAVACSEPSTTIVSSTANSATYTLVASAPSFSPAPGAKTAPIATLTVSLAQTTTPPNGNPVTPTTGATTNAYICVSSTATVPATKPTPCSSFVGTAGWTCGAAGANVTFSDVGANTTYNAFACKDGMAFTTLSGQAYTFTPFAHTPAPFTATGTAADFTAASEAIAARDSGTAYVTWDTTNLYFGMNIPGLTATNVVELYIGSTANGTSTVDGVHTFTPNALPAMFNGLYHLYYTVNGTSSGIDQFSGGTPAWGASTATFTTHYNGGGSTFVEFVIPLSGLTLVTGQDLHLLGDVWTGTTGSAWPQSANTDATFAGWQTEYLNDSFLPNDPNNAGTKQ